MTPTETPGAAPEPTDRMQVLAPTSGRITGLIAMVLAAIFVLVVITDGQDGWGLEVAAVAILVAVLAWATMLRPRVALGQDDLVLLNSFETVRVPLAAIEELAIRQVLAVRVGERRLVSPALGRSWRKMAMAPKQEKAHHEYDEPVTEVAYVDHAEQTIRAAMDDARRRAGVRLGSPEQLALGDGVRRTTAFVPLGLLALAVLGVLVAFLR